MSARHRSSAFLALVFVAALLLPSCGDDGPTSGSTALRVTCGVDPASGPVPLRVSYQATIQSSTPPNTVRVEFGDGQSELGTQGAHVYSSAGGYTLRVTAEVSGQSASCTQAIDARPAPPEALGAAPVLRLKSSPSPAIGPAPLEVTFNTCTSSDPDGDRLLHSFDFGDGKRTDFVDGCSRTHTYARGSYVAFICVSDGHTGHDVCGALDVNAQ